MKVMTVMSLVSVIWGTFVFCYGYLETSQICVSYNIKSVMSVMTVMSVVSVIVGAVLFLLLLKFMFATIVIFMGVMSVMTVISAVSVIRSVFAFCYCYLETS